MTAWWKDGELGKQSFQRSQRLGGAEGALRSGRRMSHVGQVCLSPGLGQARARAEGQGASACHSGGRWGVGTLCSQAASGSRENAGQNRRGVRASLAGEL